MDSTKELLHVRLNLGFSLNYVSFFIVNFEHLELFLFTFHIFDFLSENKYTKRTQ